MPKFSVFDVVFRQTSKSIVENVNRLPFCFGSLACFSGFFEYSNNKKLGMGRNFDWYEHPTLILFTNPPNAYASVSMVDISYLGFDQDDLITSADQELLQAPYYPFDGNIDNVAPALHVTSKDCTPAVSFDPRAANLQHSRHPRDATR